jgi:hypothetical protein
MFRKGDIVEYIDSSGLGKHWRNHVHRGDWFIVESVNPSYFGVHRLVEFSIKEYPYKRPTHHRVFEYRFKLIARKTEFGYIIVENSNVYS